jgi:hypothetical protein
MYYVTYSIFMTSIEWPQIYARDGYNCALTDFSFDPQADSIKPRCAHVLPFYLHDMVRSCPMSYVMLTSGKFDVFIAVASVTSHY